MHVCYKLVIFLIALQMVINNTSNASPLDSTGLINMKNEATIRASCEVIGSRLTFATDDIYSEAIKKNPLTNSDAVWKANQINEFGRNAGNLSRRIGNNLHQILSPNEIAEYNNSLMPSVNLFEKEVRLKKNPWKAIKAWEICMKIFKFD